MTCRISLMTEHLAHGWMGRGLKYLSPSCARHLACVTSCQIWPCCHICDLQWYRSLWTQGEGSEGLPVSQCCVLRTSLTTATVMWPAQKHLAGRSWGMVCVRQGAPHLASPPISGKTLREHRPGLTEREKPGSLNFNQAPKQLWY
jgi:hypothetical protein